MMTEPEALGCFQHVPSLGETAGVVILPFGGPGDGEKYPATFLRANTGSFSTRDGRPTDQYFSFHAAFFLKLVWFLSEVRKLSDPDLVRYVEWMRTYSDETRWIEFKNALVSDVESMVKCASAIMYSQEFAFGLLRKVFPEV